MHYYQWNIGDYARDTGHLSPLEHGIYRLLLDWAYLNERPITTEQAMRIGRGNPNETQSVLSEFFSQTEDGWEHKRVMQDVAAFHARRGVNRENGVKGGRPKATDNPVGSQSVPSRGAKPNPNQEPKNQRTKEPLYLEESNDSSCPQPDGLPDCPHSEIIKLWKKNLPHLTAPRVWEGSRREHLRARWAQASRKSHWSTEGYTDVAGGLKFWDAFFAYIANDTSLAGGFESGGRRWTPDLEWICKAANFQKIIDGRYDK